MLTGCSALALASCGGGNDEEPERRQVQGPAIDRAVAQQLAARSDEVANHLDAADGCAARAALDRLRADLTGAINDGKIPELYLEDLSATVNELQAQAPPCRPSIPPPRKEPGDNDDGGDGDD